MVYYLNQLEYTLISKGLVKEVAAATFFMHIKLKL